MTPRVHPLTRVSIQTLVALVGLAGCATGLFLALASHRLEGRLFGATATGLGLAVLCAVGAWARRLTRKRWWLAMSGALVCTASLAALLLARTPDGRTSENARVSHRYVGGAWRFRAHALGNVFPELDQFRAGFPLVSAIDPLFTRRQARTLSALTTEIYDELEADPDFHALGSVMPDAYAALLGRSVGNGHYFLYVPRRADRSAPLPALVFLHGSGGNFKAYTWLLAKAADQLGCAVIAPSFGMGDWREPATSRTIETAIDDAARVIALDPSRLHLIGLSNGGLGVSQAGARIGRRFQSLTFLSPVMDTGAISSPEFVQNWRDRPIHILTGADDDRVPLDFVAGAATTLRAGGAHVVLRTVEDADHFLLFSHRSEVLTQIEAWLAPMLAVRAPAPSP